MPSEPGRLIALVTHARHVPSVARERFGIEARVRSGEAAGFVLETCHRVEAYAVIQDHAAVDRDHLPDGGRLLVDEAVVRHVVGVAVGLDSVVIGEDQILHQLRETLTAARASGGVDPLLERLFMVALRAGRVARSWRQSPGLSLADLAIGVIERRAGPLRGRGLLVVGAGKMGALAGRSGLAAGASVSLTSRTPERSEALAARLGVPSLAFDPGTAAAADFAGIVIGLRGRWSISAATETAIVDSDVVVVDLSVPSALSEGLSAALRERHVSADDLALVEEAQEQRAGAPLRRLEALVDETVAGFLAWLDGHERRQTAEALALLAEAEREAEVTTLLDSVRLDPELRDLIDGLSRHLTARLLRRPLERLGQDPDGRHDRAVRELFGL